MRSGVGFLVLFCFNLESHGRRAWWATVHRVAKSQTWLKWLSTSVGLACRNKRNFFNYFPFVFPLLRMLRCSWKHYSKDFCFPYIMRWLEWFTLQLPPRRGKEERELPRDPQLTLFKMTETLLFLKKKKKRFWLIGDCWGKIVHTSGWRSCQEMVSESLLVLPAVPETQEVSWIQDTVVSNFQFYKFIWVINLGAHPSLFSKCFPVLHSGWVFKRLR